MNTRSAVPQFRPQDIPEAMQLIAAAGWNQTEDDWRRLLSVDADGCFAMRVDGEIAATATTVCYGREFAWIGMVLTLPQYRGRGLARTLMETCVAYAESRGVAWARLDATDMGKPLYSSLGFEDEYEVERLRREPAPLPADAAVGGFGFDAELDLSAFGADRSALVQALGEVEGVSLGSGAFACARPGRVATYLGPCVARDEGDARALISALVSRHAETPVFWDVISGNAAAVRFARELGFTSCRRLTRMRRRMRSDAGPVPERVDWLYAIAGFEWG